MNRLKKLKDNTERLKLVLFQLSTVKLIIWKVRRKQTFCIWFPVLHIFVTLG